MDQLPHSSNQNPYAARMSHVTPKQEIPDHDLGSRDHDLGPHSSGLNRTRPSPPSTPNSSESNDKVFVPSMSENTKEVCYIPYFVWKWEVLKLQFINFAKF